MSPLLLPLRPRRLLLGCGCGCGRLLRLCRVGADWRTGLVNPLPPRPPDVLLDDPGNADQPLRRHARVVVVGLGLERVRGSSRQSNSRGSDARGGGASTALAWSLGSPALRRSQCATNRYREEVLGSVTRNTSCWSAAGTESRAIVR